MARPKRRQVQVGDTIILRNQCIPDHPTLPVWIGGQQTVIPAGLRGQVVEVWLCGAAPKLIVDLGGGVHADCSHGAVGGWIDAAG